MVTATIPPGPVVTVHAASLTGAGGAAGSTGEHGQRKGGSHGGGRGGHPMPPVPPDGPATSDDRRGRDCHADTGERLPHRGDHVVGDHVLVSHHYLPSGRRGESWVRSAETARAR